MDPYSPKSPSRSARVSQACNRCRKKKIKCDQQSPACRPCANLKAECVYSQVRRERKAYRKSKTRFMQLEKRLIDMESLLKNPPSVLEKNSQESSLNGTEENQTATPVSNNNEAPILAHHHVRTEIPKLGGKTGADQNDATRVDSSLSIALKATAPAWKTNPIHDTSNLPVFMQLPPKEKAITMLYFFFTNFNDFFPIFDQSEFMAKVAKEYHEEFTGDLGWWACLNVGLALACRLRSMTSVASWDEHDNASGYIENALAAAPALALQTPSLANVQALLGMALLLQGTPNPRSYALLVTTAIRLGQNIGLHRQDAYAPYLSFAEREQRKLVFWIGYVLDMDISLRCGQPPIHNERDVDLELPGQEAGNWESAISYPDQLSPKSFFRVRVQLAVIQSAIYEKLHSARAAKQPEAYRQAAIHELDDSLSSWRQLLPYNYESTAQYRSLLDGFSNLHFVIMYFTYFNSLTLIHRSSIEGAERRAKSIDVAEPFNPYVFSTQQECIQTARTAVRLLKFVPQGNYPCIWLLLNFCASAVITLLHHVYYHPTMPTSVSDYQLVSPLLTLLDQLASENPVTSPGLDGQHRPGLDRNVQYKGSRTEIARMRKFCFCLTDHAREALEAGNPREMPFGGGQQ